MAFQEAYKTQILAKIQEIQDAKKDEKSEEVEVDISDADLETFVRIFQCTGTGTCQAIWTALERSQRDIYILTYIATILSMSATDLFDRP